MRKILVSVVFILAGTVSAEASCFGTKSFSTCTDDSGNSYQVQRYGNTTQMQGYNPRTGSNWSQQSYDTGNTTFHYGQDSRGRSWNSTCINGQCF